MLLYVGTRARVGGTITPVWTEEANARMEPLRDEARALLDDGMVLAPELRQLTAAGITAVDERLYFRQYLAARDGNRDRFDRTGHESWVNTLHLDDVIDEHAPDWGARCVAQGVLLARHVGESVPVSGVTVDFLITVDFGGVVVVGVDGATEEIETYPSSTFRFVTYRTDEPSLADDVATSTQAALLIRARL